MKVAIQFWFNKGERKNKFVAFNGGYHGDTFGAMSVGRSSGFYKPFEDMLNMTYFIPFPEDWRGNNQLQRNEKIAKDSAHKIIKNHKKEIAAVIIEPLIQGAFGMRMCRKDFVQN